ncbi:capsule assembly Wzi family protein [Pigmentiphaga soli]|uniref:Capsule assembly Wzi family protein n=1 Tax=Pigmentiphaga soli TaxID=1007095 RepID=A0ABP8H2V3_9BURK
MVPLAASGALGMALMAPTSVSAQTAVMVEAGNQELRDDIQWLIDRKIIDITASTWPLPLSALEKAMEGRKKKGLSRGDVHALLAVHRYIEQQRKTSFGLVAQFNSDATPQLGFASQSRAKATGGVYLQGSTGRLAGKLQANGLIDPITGKQSKFNVEGSYLAASGLGQVIYAGQIAHWWGPGQDGSLNWGNSATAIPGLGLQRAEQTAFKSPWLSWIGPWGYDLFIGQMQHDTAVPDARVLNMRLFARPFSGLELGASRFIQWGGKGRPNNLGSLWDALTGNSNDPNVADPSNELAGFDARYTFPLWGNPLTVYAQLAGEDEAGGFPSHYLSQVGTEFKHMLGSSRLQWHAEAADTTASRIFGLGDGMRGVAYSHGTYKNGLYHDGLPIGHPIGGTGQLLSAGVTIIPDDFRYSSRYSFRILRAEVNETSQAINQAFPSHSKWYGGEFAYSWVIRPATFRVGFTLLRSQQGPVNDGFSFMLGMNVPLAVLD